MSLSDPYQQLLNPAVMEVSESFIDAPQNDTLHGIYTRKIVDRGDHKTITITLTNPEFSVMRFIIVAGEGKECSPIGNIVPEGTSATHKKTHETLSVLANKLSVEQAVSVLNVMDKMTEIGESYPHADILHGVATFTKG